MTQEQFDGVIVKHYKAFRYLLGQKIGHERATDAVHDTYVYARDSRGYRHYDAKRPLTMLMKMAHYAIAKTCFATQQRRFENELMFTENIESFPETPHTPTPDVEDFWPKVAQLHPRHQAVLHLRFREGQSLREIGRAIGISHVAVQDRLHCALGQLRTAP